MGVVTTARNFVIIAWPYISLVFSMIAHALSVGFSYGILGSYTVAQARQFNISIYQSSWTGATQLTTFFLTSPLTSELAQMFSPAILQMVGGVVMIIGVGGTAWATLQWHAIISFGLVTGVGISLVRSASASAVIYYFQNEAGQFAMASLMVGFTCGMTGLPLLCNYIFSLDNFPDTMLTVSKIMFIHILCGLAFAPPTLKDKGTRRLDYLKSLDKSEDTLLSLTRLVKNTKVWSYLWAALFRRFGLTAFFTLITNYLIKNPRLTLDEIAQGRMTLGCAAVVGVVAMCITHNEKFDRLIPHAITPAVCGIVMMCMTVAENDISFSMLMALFGLAFGMMIANITPAANSLGERSELRLLIILEFIMEAAGSIGGSPSTSYIQEMMDLNSGIYFAASFCILSGLCILLIILCKCKDPTSQSEEHSTATENRTIIHIRPYDHSQAKYSVKQVNHELQPLIPPSAFDDP